MNAEPSGRRKDLREELREIDDANRAPPELAGANLREVAEGATLILDAIAKHHEGTGTSNIAHGTAVRLRAALGG